MTLTDIEKLTKEYADARRMLADRVQVVEDEVAAAKRKALPGIKRAVEIAKEKKARLSSAIEDAGASGLFVKPRTVIFYGIKVGLEKGKGKLEIEDGDQVVRLIEKHFPEQADVLIKTTKKPVKKALNQLSVAELKKLGITVEETTDQVVIKPTDSDVEKLVSALLDEEVEEAREAA